MSISVFIWDFDGTLYRIPEQLAIAERDSKISVIEKLKHWTHAAALLEFEKVLVSEKSATASVARICEITVYEAARFCEALFDRRPYIERDEQLIKLFDQLSSHQHYILANGWRAKIEEALPALGLPVATFKEIVTSETVGVNKPHPDGYLYIMHKSGEPAESHLMIGDRQEVDLVTAKNLGMHTCLIGSSAVDKSVVDFLISSVYEIPSML